MATTWFDYNDAGVGEYGPNDRTAEDVAREMYREPSDPLAGDVADGTHAHLRDVIGAPALGARDH